MSAINNRIYLYVKALSELGTRMDTIVLGAFMYSTTQSVVWLSASLAIGMLGGFLASLFSGVMADRMDRRKIMIWSDLLRVVLVLLIIVFPMPWMILLVRFFLGMMNSFFEVSYKAEVPVIYGEDRILHTNALISRLSSISMVAGFLGGGALSHWIGYNSVLLFDSCTYLFSAYAIRLMKWDSTRPESTVKAVPYSLMQWLVDIKEVKAYLYLRPTLALVMVVYLMDTFGSGSHNLGIPVLAAVIDPDRQSLYYGLIWGVWGMGNVLGSYLLPHLRRLTADLNLFYFVTTVFMSLGFIGIFVGPTLLLMYAVAFATGVFDACSVTTSITLFQQADNHIRGRVFGVSMLLNNLGFGLGFVASPLLLKELSLSHMVVIMHGIVISTAIGAAIFYSLRTVKKPTAGHLATEDPA